MTDEERIQDCIREVTPAITRLSDFEINISYWKYDSAFRVWKVKIEVKHKTSGMMTSNDVFFHAGGVADQLVYDMKAALERACDFLSKDAICKLIWEGEEEEL